MDWLFSLESILSLPGRVVDLAIHQSFLFHLIHNDINFFSIGQFIDNLLVLTHIPVNEIQTLSDYLKLVDYFL